MRNRSGCCVCSQSHFACQVLEEKKRIVLEENADRQICSNIIRSCVDLSYIYKRASKEILNVQVVNKVYLVLDLEIYHRISKKQTAEPKIYSQFH